LIYGYLIPDQTRLTYASQKLTYELRPVRYDQQPCSPAMLRVNRQIYNEIVGMWYGNADYIMRIIWRAVFIFGETIIERDGVLPRNFCLIRSLQISINLDMPQSESLDSWDPPIPWMKVLVDCLATGPKKLTAITLWGVKLHLGEQQTCSKTSLTGRILKRYWNGT
jgi:hypothetical protein